MAQTAPPSKTPLIAVAVGAVVIVVLVLVALSGDPEPAATTPGAPTTPTTPTSQAPVVALDPAAPATPTPTTTTPTPAPPTPSPTPSTPAPANALRVRVLDALAGTPLAGARIAARAAGQPDDVEAPVASGETDASGRATIAAPAGALEVMAVAEGYLLAEPRRVSEAERGAELEVRLERGAEVRGRVVVEGGEAMPGEVVVTLEDAPPTFVGAFGPIVPAADGSFVVPGVPAADGLSIAARCEDWLDARAELPRVGPAGVSGVVLELRRLRLSVTVRAEGAGVVLHDDLRVELVTGGVDARRQPAPGGRAEVIVPAAGAWRVRAAQSDAASPWMLVEVTPDVTPPRVTLALQPGAKLTGRVLGPDDRPIAGARVVASDVGGEAESAATDEAGRFSLAAVPGEQYQLTARATVDGVRLAPTRRTAVAPADVTLRMAALVPLELGAFVGPGGAPVKGALTCDAGAPDPHATDDAAPSVEALFDEAGKPKLDGLPAGRWTLSFLEPADGELRAWVREVDATPGQPLKLAFDGSAPRGQVRGGVRGAPRAGLVQVELRPLESVEGSFGFVAAAPAQPDGGFRFGAVPAGRYRARASWDGGQTGEVELDVRPGAVISIDLTAE